MNRVSPSIVVDNLPFLATAYSEGLAARVLFEVWRRATATLGGGVVSAEIEPWGVSLQLSADKSPDQQHSRMAALLEEISSDPIDVGADQVIVALSTRSNASEEPLGCSKFDVHQYRQDMLNAVSAYALIAHSEIAFVEQVVASVSGTESALYNECLIRLMGENGEVVMPGSFLPSLERLGLVRLIDKRVVESVISELRCRPGVKLGCNISALSACYDVWWYSILQDLRAEPDVAARLVIEITETALPPNLSSALQLVASIRRTGCRIALDDFGAGYTTIAFARSSSPDIVKLDGSFIRGRLPGKSEPHLLQHLVMLASDFAPHVVVEGIETVADLQLAKLTGAKWCQGYLFKSQSAFAARDLSIATSPSNVQEVLP